MRYSIVDKETNKVINSIVIDGEIPKSLQDSKDIEIVEGGAIGDTWDGEQFIKPPQPKPEQETDRSPNLLEKYDALVAALIEKNVVTENEISDKLSDEEPITIK